MKPYYSRWGVELYHGDCREFKFDCDLIVTDPPYGINYISNRGAGKRFGKIKGDDDKSKITELISQSINSLKNGRHIYIFCIDITLLGDLNCMKLCNSSELIWDKINFGMGDLSNSWGKSHEKIIFAMHYRSKIHREKYGSLSARIRKGSILRSIRPTQGKVKGNHHPTEKPIDILRQMIESSSILGETVYDPFAGSGSTLIAANLEGRKAIGVEIEEKYCEIAARRFEKELREDLS